MALSKASIAAIVAASTVAAVAVGNEVIGGIVLDTPFAYNAEVVLGKFKYFNHKNKDNSKVTGDESFKAVSGFVKNPRGAKLVATPKTVDPSAGEATSWTYELITKDGDSAAKADSYLNKGWKEITKDKDTHKQFKQTGKDEGWKYDWEAVNQFLKDQKAEEAKVEGEEDTQDKKAKVEGKEDTQDKKATVEGEEGEEEDSDIGGSSVLFTTPAGK